MKICILSDSHDNSALLEVAVARAKAQGVEAVLHCGDVVAPSTLHCLEKYGIPVHVIHGNNTGDLYTLGRLAVNQSSVVQYYGMDAGLTLAERRIFLVHYPHYAEAMAGTGNWDLVCFGHTHMPKMERTPNMRGGETLLLNPGTVGGVGQAPATMILGDLLSLDFQLVELDEGKERVSLPLTGF